MFDEITTVLAKKNDLYHKIKKMDFDYKEIKVSWIF